MVILDLLTYIGEDPVKLEACEKIFCKRGRQ